MPSQSDIEYALDVIERFEDGRGIDWSNVESVFDTVKPFLERADILETAAIRLSEVSNDERDKELVRDIRELVEE